MKFEELLHVVGDMPLFETGVLLAGDVEPKHIQRQLSRWTAVGKLIQLRRGLYSLASPYQKHVPHPFLVANYLVRSSYVSLQSALAYYELIPEYVATVTSVTTRRPAQYETASGNYVYHALATYLFYGYKRIDLGDAQQAFVAMPEKALLDLVHLQPGGDEPAYLQTLRLQNSASLDLDTLYDMADRADSPKLQRATEAIVALVMEEQEAYETL